MIKVKIKDLIQDDLSSIKTELIENPEVFIQNLVGSLDRTIKKPFSGYKLDLSLFYLKQVYESAFPSVKHGGLRASKAKDSKEFDRNSKLDQVPATVTWVKSVPLVDRTIVINLFKGIRLRRQVPSFVRLIELRSKKSRPTIQDRIRVGNYIVNHTEASRSIGLFRSSKISHTKLLTEIIEKEKKLS